MPPTKGTPGDWTSRWFENSFSGCYAEPCQRCGSGCRVLLASLAPANAQIYKWVGPEGEVSFSDEPRAGAEVIELPSLRPPGGQVHADAPIAEKPTVPSIVVYREVKVLEPEYGATIRDNQGIVEVVVEVDPELDTEGGDRIRILLDHRAFGEPSQTLERELYNLDRGTHRISVQVINKRGRTLIGSAPVVFYVHREFRDRLEPEPHERFAALFIEEAGDGLTRAERASLKHVTSDDFNDLMDKLIPTFVERLDPVSREAFMKRFIPSVAEQLPPEQGERILKRFMRGITRGLKLAERRALTEKMVEVVNEYLEPADRGEDRFATTVHQQEYWDRFIAMISDHLGPAERARALYLANPEQRRAFMDGFVSPHLKRLNPRQRRQFIERLVPMLAAQLPADRRREFMETVVETGMQSVSPEETGRFVRRFIQRGVNPEPDRFAEEKGREARAPRLGAVPYPEAPDEYPGQKPEERRKGLAEETPPEERGGLHAGSPEERSEGLVGRSRPRGLEADRQETPKEHTTLRRQARRDQGVERHRKREWQENPSLGRAQYPGETAPRSDFRTRAPQPVTQPPAVPPPPGRSLGPFSASTGR